MAGFWDSIKGVAAGGLPFAFKGVRKAASNFLFGQPGKFKELSTLTPEQQGLHSQLINSGMGSGAGGAFGTAADYYRDLLDPNSQTAQMMFTPEMRRFNEDIIPGLSEQFAGMGSGGLSSSGFRNAAINAGTDLSERLGAIRANLRSQGAQGLANIGQMGLNPIKENLYMQPQQGFLQAAAPGIAQAATSYFAPPGGFMNSGQQPGQQPGQQFGQSSPYGRR